MACLYTYIAIQLDDESWITDHADIVHQTSRIEQYIASLYWVFETFSTVGYGDISPTRQAEYLFTFLLQCIGMFFFAMFVSKITNLFNQ